MNLDLFLIQNAFEEFNFSQNYFYLAQLGDENPSMTRNPNQNRIQDNNECRSTTRNPYPARIEDPLTYSGCPITRELAKKMKEALYMLIQAIWA